MTCSKTMASGWTIPIFWISKFFNGNISAWNSRKKATLLCLIRCLLLKQEHLVINQDMYIMLGTNSSLLPAHLRLADLKSTKTTLHHNTATPQNLNWSTLGKTIPSPSALGLLLNPASVSLALPQPTNPKLIDNQDSLRPQSKDSMRQSMLP